VSTSAWTTDGSMPHIDLARWADTVLVAPATADVLARFALGLADDLLTTMFLALEPTKRVVLVPAMNTVMWNKAVVQGHVATLRAGGATILPPVEGNLACGEQGVGAMVEPEAIAGAVG
jgi:phosphopantothenoylcysteine decarboxylase/phosphopantothenate--cysteine ligase